MGCKMQVLSLKVCTGQKYAIFLRTQKFVHLSERIFTAAPLYSLTFVYFHALQQRTFAYFK